MLQRRGHGFAGDSPPLPYNYAVLYMVAISGKGVLDIRFKSRLKMPFLDTKRLLAGNYLVGKRKIKKQKLV